MSYSSWSNVSFDSLWKSIAVEFRVEEEENVPEYWVVHYSSWVVNVMM